MTKNDLLIFLDTFYGVSKIPLFLLDEKLSVLYQSKDFMDVDQTFFPHVLPSPLKTKKIHAYYTEYEMYTVFSFNLEGIEMYLCTGPVLFYYDRRKQDYNQLSFFKYQNIKQSNIVANQLPVLDISFIPYLQMIYGLLFEEALSPDVLQAYTYQPYNEKFKDELHDHMMKEREYLYSSAYSYQMERKFIQCIQQGNGIEAKLYASRIARSSVGKLSEDKVRKSKYMAIVGISSICNAVIEGGVSIEDAYALRDIYIMRVDEDYDSHNLFEIYSNAIMDFCALVRMRKHHDYPVWIRNTMRYIHDNLHTQITLHDISLHVHMVPTYISVQFKKICGVSISQYINEQKIEEAKFLLRTSDMKVHEIALSLNYANQSYFAKVFKDITGVLPNVYRLTSPS